MPVLLFRAPHQLSDHLPWSNIVFSPTSLSNLVLVPLTMQSRDHSNANTDRTLSDQLRKRRYERRWMRSAAYDAGVSARDKESAQSERSPSQTDPSLPMT